MKRCAVFGTLAASLVVSVFTSKASGECPQVVPVVKETLPLIRPRPEANPAYGPEKNPFAETGLGIITTAVASSGSFGFNGDLARDPGLSLPAGLSLDPSGNLLIADPLNHRIRRVDHASGMITTVAGNSRCFQGVCDGFFSGDGGLATAAELNTPKAVVADADGNIFIADTNNNRIRRVDKATGIITTVAGGRRGFSGDGGPAKSAELDGPWGIALDASGNLFIADTLNRRVRRVDHQTGIITTAVGIGTGFSSGDGHPAINAGLAQTFGVFVDASGNLLIATLDRIRRVDHTTGIITTVAGGNGRGCGGDGGPASLAQLYTPQAITANSSGDLFIADTGNNRIRRVDHATGIITTIAGTGALGFGGGSGGDEGPAVNAQLQSPQAIAVDPSGNLFIADTNNHRIRRIQMAPPQEKFRRARKLRTAG